MNHLHIKISDYIVSLALISLCAQVCLDVRKSQLQILIWDSFAVSSFRQVEGVANVWGR